MAPLAVRPAAESAAEITRMTWVRGQDAGPYRVTCSDPEAGVRKGERVGLRVAIAEDSYLIREGLRELLTGVPALELVAVCEDAPGLMDAIERESPDVVMSDIRMPPFGEWDGIRVAAELRKTRPEVGVVILSQYADPELALQLFEMGSEGRAYLLKERVGDRGQLVEAIEA